LIFAMDNLLNSSVSVSEVTKSYVDSTWLPVGEKLRLQNCYFNELSLLYRSGKTIYSNWHPKSFYNLTERDKQKLANHALTMPDKYAVVEDDTTIYRVSINGSRSLIRPTDVTVRDFGHLR
jgi:hypothetical protein